MLLTMQRHKNKCLWFDWSVIKFIFVHIGSKPNSVKWMYWLAWSMMGSLVTMWTRPMRPNICVMSRLWQETSPRFTHIDLSCLLSQSSSSGKSADSKNPTTWWFPLVRICLRGREGWVLGPFELYCVILTSSNGIRGPCRLLCLLRQCASITMELIC